MESIKDFVDRLHTQAEFARKKNVTPQAITKRIKSGSVKVVKIKGAILILD